MLAFFEGASDYQERGYELVTYRLMDGRLFVIQSDGTGANRETVDKWLELIQEGIATAPAEGPILLLYVFPNRRFSFTPYMRQKAQESYSFTPPDRIVYVGVFLRFTIILRIITLFVELNNQRYKTIRVMTSDKPEKLLQWLEQAAAKTL